jgi:D-apionolactonase
MDQTFRVYGTATPPVPPVRLQAGPVSAWLDRESGFLRCIAYEGREVVRGIYGAVRDHNWGTVPQEMQYHQLEQQENSFSVQFTARCRQAAIDFAWEGRITGGADGGIRYEFDGIARSAFQRNRIGLCVLHPLAGCAGRSCEVETVDGEWRRSAFPGFIAPHQPFQDLRSIRHQVAPGLRVEVRFEGDTFEMEDQRNWTDASFKTYGTPLALPFPVAVRPGDRVRQTVTLGFDGGVTGAVFGGTETPARAVVTLGSGPVLGRPAIGFCLSEDESAPSARQLTWIRALRPDHLRAELRLGAEGWQARLAAADVTAHAVGAKLHLALHFSDRSEHELTALGGVLRGLTSKVAMVLVFQQGHKTTPHPLMGSVIEWTAATLPGVSVAAGTDAFFAELNRERLPSGSPARPCFSINPQVHAFDARSCMETLEAQPHTVESAAHFSGHSVVVSPITLRPRWNPNATGPEPQPPTGELPASVDLRQMTLFGAAWTLGSLARLLPHPQVHSLTYYEILGWRGLIEAETGSLAPARFPSQPAERFPVYQVFRDLAGMAVKSAPLNPHPDRVAALSLLTAQGGSRLLLANLTAEVQAVRVEGFEGAVRIARIQEDNLAEWTSIADPCAEPTGERVVPGSEGLSLALAPYAYARFDDCQD